MLNYEFPPLGGGAANANYYLLKEFSKDKNIQIDLVTSSANKFRKEKFSKNITIHKLNVRKKGTHFWKMKEIALWTWKSYFYTKKLILKNKYDMCHAWFGWPSGIISYLFRKKIPYIIALRGSDVPGYNDRLKLLDSILFKQISKIVWKNAKRVIANSEGLKELALKTSKIKIDIIYNGVDTNEFKPIKKEKSKKIRLISTGRLIERKGYQFLIPALKGIQDKYELTLIGEGDLDKKLKALAWKNKVLVIFKGGMGHKEIVKELQEADLFILPSKNEGMSNSILEAMACGLPIIITNVGGSKELVNGNGVIIEAKVKSIIKILKEYKRKDLKKQGNNSRKMAEKMSWERIAKEYLGVYR